MRFAVALLVTASLFAMGCGEPAASTSNPPAPTPPALNPPETSKPAGDATPGAESAAADVHGMGAATASAPAAAPPEGFTPVALENGIVKLVPENTTIQVVGQHNPPRGEGPRDRDARTIVFEKFTGSLTFDPATKLPQTAIAEIDTNSLVAFDPRLTSHLKSRDFIEVEAYPTIKFESTRIEPAAEPGKINIVGNLTIKDVTKEITIPATVTHDGNAVTVHGQTKLNRREFNINGARIDTSTQNEFDLTLAVGKKTESPATGGR
jgi:polyisoprenoid-binding protein YceI